MESDLTVRAIAQRDWEAVTALLVELGNPAPTPATEDALRAVFLRYLHAPDTASLLVESNGMPIGVLTMHVRERLNRVIPEAWVPNFVVTERERGTGAAQILFRHACDVARARGCYRIVLESNYALVRGHRFYAREGMLDAGKYFTLLLEKG